MGGHFGINLNFYEKDADAAKITIVTFDCKEPEQAAEEDEEVKSHQVRASRANIQVR